MSEPDGEAASSESALSVIKDVVGDVLTGVPAPIRKNALKAFGRLCSAGVEYPVTLIENAIAERRAESTARIRLINSSTDQIARQLQVDPEYAAAAAKKFAHKVVRERVNLDRIATVAASELSSADVPIQHIGASPAGDAPLLSDDWLNTFETEAAQMSSEEMQRLFGKILAGEIKRPQSFSRKTIRLIAQLDNSAAALFRKFCSLSVSLRVPAALVTDHPVLDARVVSLGGNASANSLQRFGLGFDQLNILFEHGLIISDYNAYVDYRGSLTNRGSIMPYTYANSLWALAPVTPDPSQSVTLHGVTMSNAGKELLPIVDCDEDNQYSQELQKFLISIGATPTPVRFASSEEATHVPLGL